MQHFCFVPMHAVCVHAGASMPLTETRSQTSEHLAIDWPGDPKSKTRSRATLRISAPGRLACAWPVTYSTPNAHEHICAFIAVVSCGAVRPAGQNTAKPTGLAVGPQDSGMLSSLGWHPNTRTTRPTGGHLKNSVADSVAGIASRLLAPAGPEGSVLAEGPSGNPPAP